MTNPGPLGAFLAARRAQLQPQDVGLASYGERRRVPGLRREEVAQLSGVGFSYYSRLEQGYSVHASADVLDAIARTLQLTEAERRHLHTLATPPRRPASRPRLMPERVSESTWQLLAALGDAPALVLGRHSDVLAWNRVGHALFAGHLAFDAPTRSDSRPNMVRLVFRDERVRALYADWPAKARAVVANLRLLVGQHPDDAGLQTLVGELCIDDSDFARMWADHRVKDYDVATYAMRHSFVGELTVAQQTLPLPMAPDQRLIVVTAASGSEAAVSLCLLAHHAATSTGSEHTSTGEWSTGVSS